MVSLRCIVILAIIAVASSSPASKPIYDLKDAPALFEKFIKDHAKHYKDEADKAAHYETFVKNLKNINTLNGANGTGIYDINDFTDLTTEEMKKKFFGYNPTSAKPVVQQQE